MARVALTLLSLVAAAAARTRLCGNNPSADKILAHEQHFQAKVNSDIDTFASKVPLASSVIPVHWHVIASSNRSADGNLPCVSSFATSADR